MFQELSDEDFLLRSVILFWNVEFLPERPEISFNFINKVLKSIDSGLFLLFKPHWKMEN